MNVSSEVER